LWFEAVVMWLLGGPELWVGVGVSALQAEVWQKGFAADEIAILMQWVVVAGLEGVVAGPVLEVSALAGETQALVSRRVVEEV
jgi:hypothetical protein